MTETDSLVAGSFTFQGPSGVNRDPGVGLKEHRGPRLYCQGDVRKNIQAFGNEPRPPRGIENGIDSEISLELGDVAIIIEDIHVGTGDDVAVRVLFFDRDTIDAGSEALEVVGPGSRGAFESGSLAVDENVGGSARIEGSLEGCIHGERGWQAPGHFQI